MEQQNLDFEEKILNYERDLIHFFELRSFQSYQLEELEGEFPRKQRNFIKEKVISKDMLRSFIQAVASDGPSLFCYLLYICNLKFEIVINDLTLQLRRSEGFRQKFWIGVNQTLKQAHRSLLNQEQQNYPHNILGTLHPDESKELDDSKEFDDSKKLDDSKELDGSKERKKKEANSSPSWDISTLFKRYQQRNLLYYEREEMVKPHLQDIKETWEKVRAIGDSVYRIFSFQDQKTQRWSDVMGWRSTNNGWLFQMMSSISQEGTNQVLNQMFQFSEGRASQLWFVNSTAFTKGSFGYKKLKGFHELLSSPEENQVYEWAYYMAERITTPPKNSVRVVSWSPKNHDRFIHFLKEYQGDVFVKNEELDDLEDFGLSKLNREYQKKGLVRRRYAFFAYLPNSNEIAAAVIAYIGPFGINLRFLENKVLLVLRKHLSSEEVFSLYQTLNYIVHGYYQQLPTQFIPWLVDAKWGEHFKNRPGLSLHLASYNQYSVIPEAEIIYKIHQSQFKNREISTLPFSPISLLQQEYQSSPKEALAFYKKRK